MANKATKDACTEREKASGSPLPVEFDIIDHITALKGRITPLKQDHFDVMKAGLNASRVLFPEAWEFQTTKQLIQNLNEAKT